CRLVKEVVFSLDTEAIEAKYSFLGQRTYHPKLLLSVLFYGYATGVRSSRKLAERCLGDHLFIYLMQCYTPDHRTISDFRKNNLKEIEKYFVDIVRIFSKLGYTSVGKIYLDGTKLKGNASAKRTKDRAGFEKWLSEIEEEIATVLKEAETIDNQEDESCKIDPEQAALQKKLSDRTYLKRKIEEALEVMKEEGKEKINLTDRDANHMKSGGSKDIRPGYNCQAAVTESGIIMAAESVTDANDRNQLKPMIEQTESNTQGKVKEVAADSGYGSYANYEYLEQEGIDGYVPDDHFQQYKSGEYEKEENRYHYTNFEYDAATDSYVCPEGKRLKYWKTRTKKTESRQWNHKVYKGTACGACEKRSLCTKAKTRELLIDIREPLLQKMREKLVSDDGKRKYFMRQYIIEPVFGHLKFNVGYRNFLLRGLEKVRAEFKLMCIGWNLKKMLKMGIKPATV
ncbi:MAG TPA: IS1182 family transposase, partial [Candidatus Wunengus sp. YC60]|uniref:IS1182 family transposase n=1 Tax=Candidatus Wunengus sp. YC60 TaxID=3367697 RepID=UPI004024B73B